MKRPLLSVRRRNGFLSTKARLLGQVYNTWGTAKIITPASPPLKEPPR